VEKLGEACFSNSYSEDTSLCPNGTSSQTGTGAAEATTSACINGLDSLCTHGTHVAGIAAGKKTTDGIPPNGVAKESKIIAIQVFTRFSDNSIAAYDSDILAGLEWLYLNINSFQGVKVAAANMSLGGGLYYSACEDNVLKSIIDDLKAAGVATIIASGNDAVTGAVSSPGCISTAITVGATTKSDAIAWYSNEHKTMVDLLAPGSSINSSIPPNTYAYYSGTSMATPHVTGAFAAIRSHLPNATVDDIESALKVSGILIPSWYGTFTTPLIQVNGALISLGVNGNTDQTISFGSAPSVSVNETGTVSATATSGLLVTYTSATTSVCTVSGTTVTGISAGSCTILANQPGDSSYNAAPQVTQTLTIAMANQTIRFRFAPRVKVNNTGTVSATATSGLLVTYTSMTPSVCTISGPRVTGKKVGTCTINADQPGDSSYNAAPQVTQTLTIAKANQTIRFGFAPRVKVNSTGTVSATATSGLAVTYTSATTSVCKVSGTTVTGISAGSCKILANQPGDSSYNAAPQVKKNFAVIK
jgi:subtilisin family serine protease